MEVQEAPSSQVASAPEVYHAVAWRTGEIEIVTDVPEGAACFASGPHDELVTFIDVTSRHGYGAGDGKLFVPGVPEAANQRKGMDALIAHVLWLGQRAPAGVKVRGQHG